MKECRKVNMMDDWRGIAARNNAEWCDVVCRSHGSPTRFDDDAWTSRTRTPPYYPDAVTLIPDLSLPDLLSRTDPSAGCSIKDSFASLDLTAYGFRVLFDAQWIVRATASRPTEEGPRWEQLRDQGGFAKWVEAWQGAGEPTDLLRDDVLGHESVSVLALRAGDRVVAGAILSRSSNAVGISNFFADEKLASASWSGCVDLAASLFPTSPLVGYEVGASLEAAQRAGFEVAGPLRVWIHEPA